MHLQCSRARSNRAGGNTARALRSRENVASRWSPRLQWPVPLSLRPWRLGRLGGGAAAPRCCAALALTQPPPAKGLHASTRCPAEATTLIGIRLFFGGYHTYRFAYLSFAYPPHIINSRIYDVGINCHKYVKYVDSRIRVLCRRRDNQVKILAVAALEHGLQERCLILLILLIFR